MCIDYWVGFLHFVASYLCVGPLGCELSLCGYSSKWHDVVIHTAARPCRMRTGAVVRKAQLVSWGG